MRKVGYLSEFPKNCYIAQFFGKTYDEAVTSASASHFEVYYEQKHFGKQKSILVGWGKHEVE